MKLILLGGFTAAMAAAGLLGWCCLSSSKSSNQNPQEEEPTGPAWFQDVTDEVGLKFVQDPGEEAIYFMPQIVGSGGAVFDANNDGQMYVYLLQNAGPKSKSTNRLFRREANGHFTDVSKGSGLDVAGYGMGVAVGDVNNDGLPDVLVTEFGRVRLFLNNGNGTFTDVSKEAGIDNPQWATSAAFLDFDRDGWLDLVIVNYLDYNRNQTCFDQGGKQDFCGPKSFSGAVARLYRNMGRLEAGTKKVRFEDVTIPSGLGQVKGPGLGVFCADFNGDRWPDILIANDGAPNHLWINQKNGKFKEEAVERGIAFNRMGRSEGNMGIAVGDVNGKGLFDVFVTHLSEELHTCWKQNSVGYFTDETGPLGLAATKWRGTGFGAVFGDFDNDGAVDLALVNGAVKRPGPANGSKGESFWQQFAQRNQVLANDGTGHFRDVSPQNGDFCGRPAISRGLICADFDGDGGLDLLVTRTANSARLFRNVAPNRGHWLLVRAVDPALGGRDAYGAEVTVQAGKKRWKRWLNPAFSYLCSNDPRAHFGLGPADRVDRIDVIWPDGALESFNGCRADKLVTLRKGEGEKSGLKR
jgi:hypothetical protein